MPEPPQEKPEGPRYQWTVRCVRNPWFSLGIHIDHQGPFIDIHLPGFMVTIGRVYDGVLITKCPCGRKDSWTWDWRDGSPPDRYDIDAVDEALAALKENPDA